MLIGRIACAAIAVAVGTSGALAATTSQSQFLTVDGQSLAFDFVGLGASDGTGGTLSIATGVSLGEDGSEGVDIDASFGEVELFDLAFGGTSLGAYSCGSPAGATAIPNATVTSTVNCVFSLDVDLDASLLTSAVADGSTSVVVDFSDAVRGFAAGDEIVATLTYGEVAPIPLPASGLLLAGALGMLGLRRRRG